MLRADKIRLTIARVGFAVRDTARAAEFYREKLGLAQLFLSPKMALFDGGGVEFMLTPGEPAPGGPLVYFEVADIDASARTIKGRGVEFDRDPHLVAKMPDHELWLALFRDPDGNALALLCEKRESV